MGGRPGAHVGPVTRAELGQLPTQPGLVRCANRPADRNCPSVRDCRIRAEDLLCQQSDLSAAVSLLEVASST